MAETAVGLKGLGTGGYIGPLETGYIGDDTMLKGEKDEGYKLGQTIEHKN